ncbi:hypothetical protein JNW90_29885 [Micromonospora sp. STR1s_5]|nr:hypothetical protein [Micromonospora sp. STR1s_5]
MPRFFIHVRKPDGALTRDFEGDVFDDFAAARSEALEVIRELRHHFTRSATRDWVIEISDDSRNLLASIAFSTVDE